MMQISMVIISFHALIFVLLAKVSNGQATCDQQNLTNYLTCLTTDANAAVQFLAVSQTDANFVSSLDACFTNNGCTAPAIKTKNVSSDPVCENAIAQDATILQDFRTCFEAKNFTLPTVTALAYPPFNVLSAACRAQYTKMRTAACYCSKASHFPQTYAATTQCPKGANLVTIRRAISNYYCDFFQAGS